ncbi:hypothetical protein LTS17_004899 [Exophiala oligosperma]
MLLHWGTEYLQRLIPERLHGRLNEITVDPNYEFKPNETFPHLNADTGEIIGQVSMPTLTRVSRLRLRTFLSREQDLNIQFGKRLKTISPDSSSEDVSVSFEDGARVKGACIIGCDGSRSRVREVLCGDKAKPQDVGVTMINHKARYPAEVAKLLRMHHPIVKLGFSKDQAAALVAVVDASDKDCPENWYFQTYFAWWGPPYAEDLQDPRERLRYYKERASKLCEPFCSAALALGDDEVVPVDAGQQWAPFQWDNRGGRATLAGDAAHSMLPHRGQGLNNAMKDASEIVDALTAVYKGQRSLEEAITSYESEMIPRGANEIRLTRIVAEKRRDMENKDPLILRGLQKADPNAES